MKLEQIAMPIYLILGVGVALIASGDAYTCGHRIGKSDGTDIFPEDSLQSYLLIGNGSAADAYRQGG